MRERLGIKKGNKRKTTAKHKPRRRLLLAIQAVARRLSESGIDVRTAMPDKLKWQVWICNQETLSDVPQIYTGQVAECLRLFKQRIGALPKIVVLDVKRRSVSQWHPKLLTEKDIEQLRASVHPKGGAAKKVKAGR